MNSSSHSSIESYICTNKPVILHGVKEEYTTSVQSFKPVLDSYQTSTSTIDSSNSQPDSYSTATTTKSKLGVNPQPLMSLHHRSKYAQDRPFQIEADKGDCQEDKPNSEWSMSQTNKVDNQCFPNQCELQDSTGILDSQPDNNFYEYPIPQYRRQPPRLNLPRHSERMPKLPFRHYSSTTINESRQQDFPDYCDDIPTNYQGQYNDNEWTRHPNGPFRYRPLHSRRRSDNTLRGHSSRGRYETRPSLSSFEASRNLNSAQDYYETSRWNY